MKLTTRQKTLIIIAIVVPVAIILIYLLALRPVSLAVVGELGVTITRYTGKCAGGTDYFGAVEAYFVYDWNPTQEYLGSFMCEPEPAGEWGVLDVQCEYGSCVNPCKDVECPTFCYNNKFNYNPKCNNAEYLTRKHYPSWYTDPYYDKINWGCIYYSSDECGICYTCDDVKGCIPKTPCCGNNICEAGEVYSNCPTDCPDLCIGITLSSYCASNTILRTETHCNHDNQEISYTDAKCEDNNPCTIDKCVGTSCTHTLIDEAGIPYCDNLIYNYNPTCNPTTGEITFQQVNCDDNNLCTRDSCDPNLACINMPIQFADTKCEDSTYYYSGRCNSITGEIIYYFQEPCEQGCNVTSGLCNYEAPPILPPTLLLMIVFVAIILISGSGILIYYKRVKK